MKFWIYREKMICISKISKYSDNRENWSIIRSKKEMNAFHITNFYFLKFGTCQKNLSMLKSLKQDKAVGTAEMILEV